MLQAEKNRLLRSLSPSQRQAILCACAEVVLPQETHLYRPDEDAPYLYFLTSGLASVVVHMGDGSTAEAVFVGTEGLTGSMQLLGPARAPTACLVQLDATGLRIPRAKMARLFHSSEEIRHRVLEYIQQECFTLSQLSGCNATHQASARLARWLLMAQDRTDDSVLEFTQEFLAEMLGLQRSTVSILAGKLQESGWVKYCRGKVTIRNRPALEVHACECYRVVSTLQRDLYQRPWATPSATLHS